MIWQKFFQLNTSRSISFLSFAQQQVGQFEHVKETDFPLLMFSTTTHRLLCNASSCELVVEQGMALQHLGIMIFHFKTEIKNISLCVFDDKHLFSWTRLLSVILLCVFSCSIQFRFYLCGAKLHPGDVLELFCSQKLP